MSNLTTHKSWYFPIVLCYRWLVISTCFVIFQILSLPISYAAPPGKAVTDYEVGVATQEKARKEEQEAAALAQWEYEQSRGRLVQLDTYALSYYDDTFGTSSCSPTCVFTDLGSTAYLKSSGWFEGNKQPNNGITHKLVFKDSYKKKHNTVELHSGDKIVSSLKLDVRYMAAFPVPGGGMFVVTSNKNDRVKVFKLDVTPDEKKKLKTTLLLDVEGIRPQFHAGFGTDTIFSLSQEDESTGMHSNHIYSFDALGALIWERRDKEHPSSHVIWGFASDERGYLMCTSKYYKESGVLSYYDSDWEQSWSVNTEQCGMVASLGESTFFAQVKKTDAYKKSAYAKISSRGNVQWKQEYDPIYGDFSDPFYNENRSLTVRTTRGIKPYFVDIQNVNFD